MRQVNSLHQWRGRPPFAVKRRVLLVADARPLRTLRGWASTLTETVYTDSLQDAWSLFSSAQVPFDVVVSTVELDGAPQAGLRLASELRRQGFRGPVLLLQGGKARDLRYHAARLQLEWLHLPVQDRVFKAKLRMLLWPLPVPEPEIHCCGDLQLNVDDFSVVWQSQRFYPTRLEFDLLLTLIRQPGHVFSTAKLLSLLWPEDDVGSNVVRQTVRRIRKRLPPEIIETTPGGYHLRPCA